MRIRRKQIQNKSFNYAVGYCRPPLHSRFKPGQSGNPKGRSKGHKTLNVLLRQSLNQGIEVTMGGEKHIIPKFTAMVMALINKALQGDMRAITVLFPYILRMEQAEAEVMRKVEALSANDQEILKEYAKRIVK